MSIDSRSPHSKRGGSSSPSNPHRGTVKTTATAPREVRPGEEKAIAKENKAYVRKMNS